MGDCRILEPSEHCVLHKADSGAMRFRVKFPRNITPAFTFTSKDEPQKELYKITMGYEFKIENMLNNVETTHAYGDVNYDDFVEFWITWYNKKIKMGTTGRSDPFLVSNYDIDDVIGYVQFDVQEENFTVEWMIEECPVIPKPLPCKIFNDELTWTEIRETRLPPNALIGGFEREPTYVVRANFRGSLIPGKYVPSCSMAFLPWGHREHSTRHFEVLCGHNAKWVKTKLNLIPQDAFVAGHSEVNQEPLYVGRAMHDGQLVIGKVHVLYKTCYLPYYGKEIETSSYEILTVPKKVYCHVNFNE